MEHTVEAPLGVGAVEIGRAAGGLAALGAVAALGVARSEAANVLPSALLVHLGALLLTGPTLLVAHPLLGFQARADQLVAVLGRAFVRSGDLALGLTPLLAFFGATTSIGGVVFVGLVGVCGAVVLVGAGRELLDVEPTDTRMVSMRMRALVGAWALLTSLGAMRIGWEVWT